MSWRDMIFRRDAHGYTRVNSPWILEEHHSVYGKLTHYLSGGGMATFGRTVEQEVVKRRQRGFLVVAAILSVIWTIFYII